MKANEIFELAEKIAALKKPEAKPMRNRRPPRHIQKMSNEGITALLLKKLEEAEALKQFLDNREKANKKEDKKKEWDFTQTAMALVISYPIIGLILFLLTRK